MDKVLEFPYDVGRIVSMVALVVTAVAVAILAGAIKILECQ